MKVIWDIHKIECYFDRVVMTIGAYDGIHIGHQEVIKHTVNCANEERLPSVLLTFNPIPIVFFKKVEGPMCLTTLFEKIDIISNLGVDFMVILSFNEELAHMPPLNFLKNTILSHFFPKAIIVGEDFTFGYQKQGDTFLLREFCREHYIKLKTISLITKDGYKVGASIIRKLIKEGNVEEVPYFLGRYYSVEGVVVKGTGLATYLGFPTVNISYDEGKIVPAPGSYATIAVVNDKLYYSTSYIGKSPTNLNKSSITLETHIHNFSGELYGEKVSVYFVKRIREEIKFESNEELISKIREDIEFSRQYLSRTYKIK